MRSVACEQSLEPARVIAHLHELDSLTGGPDGARRLAWTEGWRSARQIVRRQAHPGLVVEEDRAGNLWFFLPGASAETLLLGSHLDAVPGGGWLDGCLGVLAGLEVLRGLACDGAAPPRTVAVVDWADEEGARFGRSLFGSSAFTGMLDPGEFAALTDDAGAIATDVLRDWGVEVDALIGPDPRLAAIVGYLELHIEQGPVLERDGQAIAPVSGTVGIERDRFVFGGQASHAGPTPMDARHDAMLAASEVALALENLARRAEGRATTGRLELEPGVPTVVAEQATLYVDLRHGDAQALAGMHEGALAIATERAERRGCSVRREHVWGIEPRTFDAELVALAGTACRSLVKNADRAIVSGALHDAAVLADCVPTAMIFCASLGGLSHCVEEDSREGDIEFAVLALDATARAALTLDIPDSASVR